MILAYVVSVCTCGATTRVEKRKSCMQHGCAQSTQKRDGQTLVAFNSFCTSLSVASFSFFASSSQFFGGHFRDCILSFDQVTCCIFYAINLVQKIWTLHVALTHYSACAILICNVCAVAMLVWVAFFSLWIWLSQNSAVYAQNKQMKSSGSHSATQLTQKIHAHQRICGLKNFSLCRWFQSTSSYHFFTWTKIQLSACLPKPLPQFQNEVRGNWHFHYKAFICRLCRLQMASIFELDNFLCTQWWGWERCVCLYVYLSDSEWAFIYSNGCA